MIAFQLMLGLFCIVLGLTGLSRRVVNVVPPAIKAGVIMGAGIAAVMAIFKDGGRFDTFPWTISIAIGIAFYIIFSHYFRRLKASNAYWGTLAKLGIFPIIVLAIILAPLFGEAPWPDIEWGITSPDFVTLWREYTVFGLGLPPLSMFLQAIPIMLAAYIVLFGDVLQGKALLDEADELRRDEYRLFPGPGTSHLRGT